VEFDPSVDGGDGGFTRLSGEEVAGLKPQEYVLSMEQDCRRVVPT
jgi:hypothetical protein